MLKVIRSAILCGLMFLVLAAPAGAGVARTCTVSYETRDGWSSGYTLEVTFMTGRELNTRTKTFEYQPLSSYALIWFAPQQVAIIELDDVVYGVGEEFDNEDFRKLFRFSTEVEGEQINGRTERGWKIRGKRDYGRFIDRRAEK